LCVAAISDLSLAEQFLYRAVAEHWSVFADERRAVLTVSTKANRAFHVALHRNEYSIVGDAAPLEEQNFGDAACDVSW